MKFSELEPRFAPDNVPIAQASSVMFLCPKCFHDNGGAAETHHLRAVNHGHQREGEPSWVFRGTGAGDFTLDWAPGSQGRSSIQVVGGCEAHFNIVVGDVRPAPAPGGNGRLSW